MGSSGGKGTASVLTLICHSSHLIALLGLVKPRVAGIIARSLIRIALMTAEIPLAASEWPIFVLTAPSNNGLSTPGRRSLFIAIATALASNGSPCSQFIVVSKRLEDILGKGSSKGQYE